MLLLTLHLMFTPNIVIHKLNLRLRLADKSAKILSNWHVWPINQPLDSTIVAQLADKSVELIVQLGMAGQ